VVLVLLFATFRAQIGFSVSCVGENWLGLSRRLMAVIGEPGLSPSPAELARAMLPLASHLEIRRAGTASHQEALAIGRAALHSSPLYPQVQKEVGPENADAVTILLFAIADRLKPSQREELGTLDGPITEEVDNLRAQLTALLDIQDAATGTP